MNLIKALICAVIVAFICNPTGAWSQAKKIKVGYSSDAPGSLVTWLAREAGIFAKNGLDADLVRVRTTIGVMALLSGELDFRSSMHDQGRLALRQPQRKPSQPGQ